MADTMNAAERGNLLRAVQIARDPNSTREQIQEAKRIQGELKKKYPKTYGATRMEMFNIVESGSDMNKGGVAKKVAMAKGGMANGKPHMYVAGGSVTDNAGLRALKKASPEAYKKITGN